MSGQAETTYYTNGRVMVTNARFVVDAETYAISGITSVKLGVKKPNRILPILLIVLTYLVLTKGGGPANLSIWHWLLALLPGVLWMALQRTHYTVTLASASGENRALTSKLQPFVREVIDALNQAIVRRA